MQLKQWQWQELIRWIYGIKTMTMINLGGLTAETHNPKVSHGSQPKRDSIQYSTILSITESNQTELQPEA